MSTGTPYWLAFLKHPYNKAVALGLVAASIALSLPWGVDGLGLGFLALAAVQMVGLALVPGLPTFRVYVDKMNRRAEREARRQGLLQEVEAHFGSPHLASYEQMCARVASLYRTASDKSTALVEREVEQLDELTVDYLRLCLSDAVLREGATTELGPAVLHKLREVDRRLGAAGLERDEEQQLRLAKADYEEAIARQARMASRRSALEASMVSMPIRLEEVYQMVMTSPRTGNLSQLLEESVSKLRLAEEAALDVERALGTVRPEVAAVSANDAPALQDQRRAVGQRRGQHK